METMRVFLMLLLELRDYDPMFIDTESDIGKLSFKHVSSWTWEPENNHNPRRILDFSVMDDQNEKRDQMFACCGATPEGSLRIIRSGIYVEKLLKTVPVYQGITGTWTVKMKVTDVYHSFLVLSFVEETRVLSVGLSFKDVTGSVGIQSDVCTLACGLTADGLLVQIHQDAIRLCMPTMDAHSDVIPVSSPFSFSWFPENVSINLGAVGKNLIVFSTSNPCFLSILTPDIR